MQFLAKNKKLLELGPSPGFLYKKTCTCTETIIYTQFPGGNAQ